MRLGLDLRTVVDPERRRAMAVEADRLGLWAVMIGRPDGETAVEAAALAVATEHIHLAMWLDARAAHPLALAEEVAVLDHLSRRRAMAVIDGPDHVVAMVERFLAGALVDRVALTPCPAQTAVPVWLPSRAEPVSLTGELDHDRETIDALRDGGDTHRFVTWPGPVAVLARHLVTRAAAPAFPQVVADLADIVAPINESGA